jgi:asparagine synthase (glutamine-hydrolysing)
MTMAVTHKTDAPACEVAMRETYGWRRYRSGEVTLWLKGFIYGLDGANLVRRLAEMRPPFSIDGLATLLCATDGHYAMVVSGPSGGAAAVDWVRSIPLAAAQIGGRWIVDDQPERLRRLAGLGRADIDPDAALSLGMAGYTIDAATLYRGLELLVPGEFIWFAEGEARRHRYYTYRPWRVRAGTGPKLEKELAETTLGLMERMVASLDGRPLLLPLSAGRDSRLIASAMCHLGYANVRCFSYGRAGNFEAKASRAIAEKLGYPWTFVPATIRRQRRFFAGEDYARYLEIADSGASVPFVQDMAPMIALKQQGYVPDDAVIVNGNTGDFISGNHILSELQHPARDLAPEGRWRRIIDGLLRKHFALWRSLATPAAEARIATRLRQSIERAGGTLGDPETDHGLYEYAEFQDRQSKYVITGQRIYEFLGHEWRLPLWDNAYLRFWEGVPLAEKAGQALYARTLRNANWGGVWDDIPVNRTTVRPLVIAPLRLMAKALHAPLGQERWHRFERRYFQYWMDATANSACVPYDLVRRDRRGARHHIAWLAELYLARHGVTLAELGPR